MPRVSGGTRCGSWHADFWDGPRSGMLTYRGQEYWFEVVAESEDDASGWYRRFAVLRRRPDQHADELRWHELFRRCVGGHTDYTEDGQRPVGELQPHERWAEFYEAYQQRTPPDLSRCEVVGWFKVCSCWSRSRGRTICCRCNVGCQPPPPVMTGGFIALRLAPCVPVLQHPLRRHGIPSTDDVWWNRSGYGPKNTIMVAIEHRDAVGHFRALAPSTRAVNS